MQLKERILLGVKNTSKVFFGKEPRCSDEVLWQKCQDFGIVEGFAKGEPDHARMTALINWLCQGLNTEPGFSEIEVMLKAGENLYAGLFGSPLMKAQTLLAAVLFAWEKITVNDRLMMLDPTIDALKGSIQYSMLSGLAEAKKAQGDQR